MIISWNTTNQCNMFCDHCYREAGEKTKKELSTDEGKKLIEEIACAGFKIMIFSGGEPLMRNDLIELIGHAKKNGLRPVIGSNGTFIDSTIAKNLKHAGLMGAGISLDSLIKEKHDKFRKLEGAWNMAVEGMKNCKAAGIPFQIHTTVMNWNENEIEEITDFAVAMGAVAHHIFFLIPTGRGKDIVSSSLDSHSYENLIQRIMKKASQVTIEVKPTCAPQFMRIASEMNMNMRFGRGCLAGTAYCIISPDGYVQPCAYMDMKVANVRESSFDSIWKNNEIFNKLRTMEYGGACGHCKYGKSCGGCRARAAFYHDGDFMQEDSICKFAQGEEKNNG